MSIWRKYVPAAVLAGLLTAIPSVQAEERFGLSKAVPDGVFVYVHAVHNPERNAINERWAAIWKQVADARIQDDVRDTIRQLIPNEEDRSQFDKVWNQVTDLIAGVDWSNLVSKEFVYCSRLRAPVPEYLFLMRSDKAAAAKNAEGLRKALAAISEAAGGEVKLEEAEAHGAKVWRLVPPPEVPMKIELAVREDVIALGISQVLLDDSLAMLAGEKDGPRLTANPKFQAAFKGLPKAEDTMMFFDPGALIEGIRGFVAMATMGAQQDPEAQKWIAVVNAGLKEVDILESIAATEETDGQRVLTHSIVRLKPGAAESPLGKVFVAGKAPAASHKMVPKEATDFSVSSGIDLKALYTAITGFINKNVPEGQSLLADWEAKQAEIGFHVEKDLLDWLTLEFVSVSLPASSPSPFSSSDWVIMLRMRDAKAAKEHIDGWIDKLQALLKENQQELLITPAEVKGAAGFRSVTHPMVAMFLRPVYGFDKDWMILSNSAAAIEKCLATARGEHPSVLENPRFQREGVKVENATSMSFTDQRQLGQEIAAALGAVSFAMNLVGATNQEPEARAIFGGIGKIIAKLSPIAAKVNFLSSTSSATRFDGQAWHTEQVTTYRLDAPTQPGETPEKAPAGS